MDEKQRQEIYSSMQKLLEMDEALALDCINYVFTQLNSESFIGKINPNEYSLLVAKSIRGLDKVIFLKHYSRDIVSKKAFQTAAGNLTIMLYTRPLNGNDREILLREFESRRPAVIGQK